MDVLTPVKGPIVAALPTPSPDGYARPVRRSVLPCVLLAAAIGVAALLIAPDTQDMAAAVFRSNLFGREGFVVVNDAWYGGHDVPAYSLAMPPLGALLGPRLVAVAAVVVAAGLFAVVAQRAFERRGAWLAGVWFGAAVGTQVLTGRVAFLLGVPLAIGAVLAAQRGHSRLAVGLALATPLASPVDGAFLALAGLAWTIGGGRRLGLAIAAAGLVPVALLTAVFPEGGDEPFVATAFWPALSALVALAVMLPRQDRILRVGAGLYALAVVFCFVVPTAVGGNVTRLAALVAGPVVAGVGWPRRRAIVLVAALPLVYWQVMPAVRDVAVTSGDPSTQAAYYTPLIDRLQREPGPLRVEVPFTRSHWEAARLAGHVPLARGWERQLDRKRNPLFYDDVPLTATRYVAWLHENAVSFVALPDAPLDASAQSEGALLRRGVLGLHEIWHSAHWRLFAVRDPTPLGVRNLDTDGFTLNAVAAGTQTVRVRFSPHWAVVVGQGCVSRAPGGFTRVRATGAETLRVGVRVDPLRAVLARGGERCSNTTR
jgi:hypothetical protein